jgi:hypothetical protein
LHLEMGHRLFRARILDGHRELAQASMVRCHCQLKKECSVRGLKLGMKRGSSSTCGCL